MKISVIVPAYNVKKTLSRLLDSLSHQSCKDFEVIVVDDCSQDNTCQVAESYDCTLVRLPTNRGPATCRNIGAKKARGDIVTFTDGDCRVEYNWIERIEERFLQNDIDAVMGKVVLMPSTLLGDSISALGFPAGGAIGFDKIWKVDPKGFTDSLSTCNCAIRKNAFEKIGGFDESFPFPGGEDTLLAYDLRKFNYRIKYCPDVVVYHAARDSFGDFVKWQFRRGVSSFIFSTKISNKVSFLSLRIWSTGNILKVYCHHKIFPMVLFLLGTGVFVQFLGFLSARNKRNSICRS
jgi:glycosyltransferase involved in cell wall biosynthesis